MPFDALKGFREALAEKERIVVARRELSEEQKSELDLKLHQIKKKDIVVVEFFCNGEYAKVTGMVTGIDEISRVLKILDTSIDFDDISDLH